MSRTYTLQYFGVLFAAVGIIILIRVLRKGAASSKMRNMLLFFSVLITVSGVMCVLLDENWFSFSPPTKVPMFTVVGTSVCFAFVFSLLDLVNFTMVYLRSRALIENQTQIYLVLFSSCIMGAIYGFIFGMMDVEDQRGLELRDALILEEEYCIPIGIVVGGLAGMGTHILGNQSQYSGYNGLHQFHENDDI